MTQSIVSKGKDIDEAITLGLNILQTSLKEVNIEIMQHDKKGFLKIGTKDAVVKLTKIEANDLKSVTKENVLDEFELMEQFVSSINIDGITDRQSPSHGLAEEERVRGVKSMTKETLIGMAWVKDGVLSCQSSETHYPLVTVQKGIKLFKNQQLVGLHTLIVSEKDEYKLAVENDEVKTNWKVTLDANCFKATIHVKPGYRIIRKIKDVAPGEHIKIIMEEQRVPHNSMTYEDIMKELETYRVLYGFNHSEIIKATEATEAGDFEIATGTEASLGKDGWFEAKVLMKSETGMKLKEDGSVDYRESTVIPTIKEGQSIGVIHPPVPGLPGRTVRNEPLPAKQTKAITLQLAPGLEKLEQNVISLKNGRPKIETRGLLVRVSVLSKLTHKGDVNLSSGNIHFKGDVEVTGQVEEGMSVKTSGDVFVHKEINHANVTATGSITSNGHVVSSIVSAGKSNIFIAELGSKVAIILAQLQKMLTLIEQLTNAPAFKKTDIAKKGLRPLIIILLEKKFNDLPSLLNEYNRTVKKASEFLDDPRWKDVSRKLSQHFLTLSTESITMDSIKELVSEMCDLHDFSQTEVEPEAYIQIPSVVNSELYSSGDITINGEGSVHSTVYAGGRVAIDGIVRGGHVFGKVGVIIHEVGSDKGTKTTIAVPSDQMIKIHKAMDGTVIKVGHAVYTFSETTRHIRARLDEKHRLVLH
ncbi:FapA family protein [Bacillus sp. FJAT-45037]|uniref:FapA family protein n=1 Tax=Bacillus sp. FJAT-45037 TaxID=2011007 RepID=UPI000C237952|nr:FapA family protein [Bacillus sp. FJAT-45037]